MPYYDAQDGFHNGAEHDTFYAYPTDKALSEDDFNKMIAFGWHQEYNERDYCEDFSYNDYRPDESWSCYV
jgi:hypothetical protein